MVNVPCVAVKLSLYERQHMYENISKRLPVIDTDWSKSEDSGFQAMVRNHDEVYKRRIDPYCLFHRR